MAQYYRPQRENRGRSRLLYITCLVIIIFLLDMVAGGRLRAGLRGAAASFHSAFVQVGMNSGLTGYFVSHGTLASENSKLRAELAAYHAKDAAYAAMAEENSRLRTLINFVEKKKGVGASVVSAPSVSPYGTFMINVGSANKVAISDVVFTADGFAVGIIADLGGSTSLVSEVLAPNTSIEAVIGDTVVVLQGEGGGNARAQAPRDSEIKVGDIVRAPKLDAPVAIVQKVESVPTSAYKVIYARIPANLETLSIVYVAGK